MLHAMRKLEPKDTILRLSGVSRVFSSPAGAFRALDDVSLDLPGGSFVAVVGRSGSGKSTLANLIAGLDHPSTGEIVVDGTPVHSLGEDALASWRGRNVGIVFQFFQLLPTLTIAENVALPMDFGGTRSPREARTRAVALLESVGIADQADKLPSALSGGQQQRAAIARALANDPRIIVADEPTGNLDAHTSELVFGLLSRLTEGGRTVVMVTHEREVASRVDLVIDLVDGRVASIEQGTLRKEVRDAERSVA